MKTWLAGYAAALLVVGVLDGLWLGFIARDFYRRELGSQMIDSIRLLPAAVFYLGFPAGIIALALTPPAGGLGVAVLRSALLGLIAYGVYDMTNWATLTQWSARLAFVDMAWGTLVAGCAGAAAYSAMRWVERTPAG